MKDYHINIFYSEEDEGYIADIPDLVHCWMPLAPKGNLSPRRCIAPLFIRWRLWQDRSHFACLIFRLPMFSRLRKSFVFVFDLGAAVSAAGCGFRRAQKQNQNGPRKTRTNTEIFLCILRVNPRSSSSY
jgi:hypothetical protein